MIPQFKISAQTNPSFGRTLNKNIIERTIWSSAMPKSQKLQCFDKANYKDKSCPSDVRKHCFAQTPSVQILTVFQWNFLLPALLWAHLFVFIWYVWSPSCADRFPWDYCLGTFPARLQKHILMYCFDANWEPFRLFLLACKHTRNCLNLQMSLGNRHMCLCSDDWLSVMFCCFDCLKVMISNWVQRHFGHV